MIEYYKGFVALIEYYENLGLFTGFVYEPTGIHITVSASNLDDLLVAYWKAVDEYIESHLLTYSRDAA